MPVEAPARSTESEIAFPAAEVEQRLRRELEQVAGDTVVVRGGWEPLLDSLVIVGVLIVLDELFDFPLPPDEIIRPGGYSSVDEAVGDISERARHLWLKKQNRRSKS
jgi:hypothetical protein